MTTAFQIPQLDDDLAGVVPTIECLLAEGNPTQIQEYREHLSEKAFDFAVYAFTAAGLSADPIDPNWRSLDKDGKLSNVMFLLTRYAIFEFWCRFLADPERTIIGLGN
jgi:hypothetical protein